MKTKKHNILSAILFAIVAAYIWAVEALASFRRSLRHGFGQPYFANAEIGAGTHHKVLNKFSAVAITERHLLYKFDSTDATGKRIVVCGAQDRAVFVVPEEVSTLMLTGVNPAPVEAIMLGVSDDSVRMVAAGALNPGDVVYPAAAGRVNTYVGLGSTGTNYPVGVVLVGATAAGQIVEVQHVNGLVASTQ